jgi:hypothetical protein
VQGEHVVVPAQARPDRCAKSRIHAPSLACR